MADQADHDPIFHPHLVDEVQLVGAFDQQLQADLARHRRLLADGLGFLGGPFVAVSRSGVERFEDVFEPVGREIAVDLLQVADDRRLGHVFVAQLVEDRLGAERLRDDPFLGFFEPVRRQIVRRKPQAEAFRAVSRAPVSARNCARRPRSRDR